MRRRGSRAIDRYEMYRSRVIAVSNTTAKGYAPVRVARRAYNTYGVHRDTANVHTLTHGYPLFRSLSVIP